MIMKIEKSEMEWINKMSFSRVKDERTYKNVEGTECCFAELRARILLHSQLYSDRLRNILALVAKNRNFLRASLSRKTELPSSLFDRWMIRLGRRRCYPTFFRVLRESLSREKYEVREY